MFEQALDPAPRLFLVCLTGSAPCHTTGRRMVAAQGLLTRLLDAALQLTAGVGAPLGVHPQRAYPE